MSIKKVNVITGEVETLQEDAPVLETAEETLTKWREKATLSNIQFALICASLGYMTAQEAEDWVGSGQLPQVALDAIAALPVEQQAGARIRFKGARIITRNDQFLSILATLENLSATDLDNMFIQGALL